MSDGRFQYRTTLQPNARYRTANFGDTSMRILERICAHDGSIAIRDNKGKSKARQQSCYICRQYNPKTINTQWKCLDCGMPLCQADRRDPSSQRYSTCLDEHRASNNNYIGCNLMQRLSFFLPDALKKYTETRQQTRIRDDEREKKRIERREKRERERERQEEARKARSNLIRNTKRVRTLRSRTIA